MEKKFDLKKFLSNNAIIILIILLALFVGCTTQNFFTETNGKNLLLNVAPRFIIACGVSGCLITKGTDLSAGRMVGLSACLAGTLLQKADYSGKFFPNMPFLWCMVGSSCTAYLCSCMCYLWCYQRYRSFLSAGSCIHRNLRYAANRIRCLPGLYQRNSYWWLSCCLHRGCKRTVIWFYPLSVPDRFSSWYCNVVCI